MSSVTPITAAAAAGTGGAASTNGLDDGGATTSMSGANSQLDRDAFLKLLVAQLKYQDPTNPTDASQMVTQSAQLSMVDRLNEIATQLSNTGISQRLSLASTMVGKEVTFPDADGVNHTALVTSARVDGDEVMLTAGDFSVPMGSVTAINAPAPTSPAPTSPASPGATDTTGTAAA